MRVSDRGVFETDSGGRMAAADESNRSTVLVAEDQDDTACLLRFILERAGHSVTHVADGKAAGDLIVTPLPPTWSCA